jgi:hypothetical protein
MWSSLSTTRPPEESRLRHASRHRRPLPRNAGHLAAGRQHQLRDRGRRAPAPDPARGRAGGRPDLVQPRRRARAPLDAFEPRRQPQLEADHAARALQQPHARDVADRGRPHRRELLRRRLLQRAPQPRALRRRRRRRAQLPGQPGGGDPRLRHGPLEFQHRRLLQRVHDGGLRRRRPLGDPRAQGQARRLHDHARADAADRRHLELPGPVQRLQQLSA